MNEINIPKEGNGHPSGSHQPRNYWSGSPAPSKAMPSYSDDELNILELFTQLFDRKLLLLAMAIAGAAVGVFVGQLRPTLYQARSVVQVDRSAPRIDLPEELVGSLLAGDDVARELATEIHIFSSRLVLDPVVEDLDLNIRIVPARLPIIGHALQRYTIPIVDRRIPDRYARPAEAITVESFEVAEDAVGTVFPVEILSTDTFMVDDPAGHSIEGTLGSPVKIRNGVELTISEINAPIGRVFFLSKEPVWVAARRLARNFSADIRYQSEVFDFKYTDTSRKMSKLIINAIVESYRTENLKRRFAEIDQTLSFIQHQIPDVSASLKTAEMTLSAFLETEKAEGLSLGTHELIQRSVRLENALRDLEFREEVLAKSLSGDHRDLKALDSGKLQLEKQIAEIRSELSGIPNAEQELTRLTKRVEDLKTLHAQLQGQIKQLQTLKASTVSNIHVLDPAESASVAGPDRTRPIIIGGMGAFLITTVLVFALNQFARRVEDARSIEELGSILLATVDKVKNLAKWRPGRQSNALALADPTHSAIESIRNLRTGIQFSLSATSSNSLMVTSCAPSDGKSFISLNLALVAASVGSRVLLLDCDLRRGGLRNQFPPSISMPGLTEILMGTAQIEDTIFKEEETGLEFIGTGALPRHPSELLSKPTFSKLVRELEKVYDLVILDTPPVLAVTDPCVVGQCAGNTILIARHLHTRHLEVLTAQKALFASGVYVSGIVINQADRRKSKYQYYYGGKY
ncbi:polysaccharide biosynthesis tyrosine autokinase [Pseudoruegeria sp. HB172150]|uniref:polysaccharide biosynthesis tyrosine autokinase n=1 Tax=Pseudoruegeria sp. HB172150 TaxID=2721164 RepID=UPI001552B7EF|nr:polysaccharide biosynthesis tyrosine autokinase [Pseudoruegeria sp. HB172150]